MLTCAYPPCKNLVVNPAFHEQRFATRMQIFAHHFELIDISHGNFNDDRRIRNIQDPPQDEAGPVGRFPGRCIGTTSLLTDVAPETLESDSP